MNLAEKAARLRALHRSGRLLVLPNAWDAASARVLTGAGFEAIATASHAVADSLGYDDGEGAPSQEMFAAAGRITRSVDVPVSVDAEGGYGLAPADLAARLRDAGAAGCNVEDTAHGETKAPDGGARVLVDVKEQAARIEALREADGDLVINARVDVYAGPPADPADDGRLRDAVTRARSYLDAGADCVFVIGVADETLIATLVARIPGPVNVLYRPGMPSLARLEELGVARVTFGPGLQRATLGLLERLAGRLRSGEDPYETP
jgi:2-methylisocitrate lyase-like PEP mutase family enzyme